VIKDLEDLDVNTRQRLVEVLTLLSEGESLGMAISRPMPTIANGAHEIRLKDRLGQYRIFYFTKFREALIVFHFIKKKSQHTPHHEIAVAKKRLADMV
jgi:phage-related protein